MSTATMAYMAIASAVASTYSSYETSRAQQSQRDQQLQNIKDSYAANYNASNVQQQQLNEQTADKKLQNNLAAQKAKSTATVSAGANGVTGQSVDALLNELAGDQSRYNASVDANYQNATMAYQNQKESLANSASSQSASVADVQQPDYLGSALRIGEEATQYSNRDQKWSKYYNVGK
jgi:hypothetical protein